MGRDMTEDPFETVVAAHHAEIHRYLVRATSRPGDADDLSQETFVRAYKAYRALPSDANVRAWLFAIATNLCRNHFRAEGRHEYTVLAFVPGSRPFDLFDLDRKGRIKLYVKRVFITDEAEILPRYLRFVRGLVDSTDLPLNLSREMIQESPILMAIRKAVTSRMLTELEKLADKEPAAYAKIWDNFGAVLKEGIYEDVERRDALLALSRFKASASAGAWRSLKDYVASLKENQTAIYYVAGDDIARLEASPHLEGFRARGVEVLLLTDPVDSFWVTSGASFEGKAFKSVTQGAADLTLIPRIDAKEEPPSQTDEAVTNFVAFIKETLGEAVSDVRASDRLTDSPVCLVAPETGLDRQLEKLLAGAGRLKVTAKPILEINPRHAIVVALASLGEDDLAFKQDAAHLLFDEARVLEGERPADARMFSDRLVNTEETNAEGRKSHHLADGCMLLYRRGDEYADMFCPLAVGIWIVPSCRMKNLNPYAPSTLSESKSEATFWRM